MIKLLLLGGTALAQAIPAIASHFSIVWSVCLFVICCTCAHCLKLTRLMDFDAI